MELIKQSDLSGKLENILNEIDRSPNLRVIMKRTAVLGSPLGKLFLSNSDKVFVTEEFTEPGSEETTKIRLPVLFWTSVALIREPGDRLRHLATLLDLKRETLETSKADWYAVLRKALDVKDFRDLLYYYCLKFARSSTKTKNLVTGRDFSFRIMQQALADYAGINQDELFCEFNAPASPDTIPGADIDVVKVLEKLKSRFIASVLENPLATVLADAPISSSLLLDQLASRPFQYVRDLESSAGLKSQDYQQCLNELYDLKAASNMESVFWCENREHEPVMMTTKASLGAMASGPNCPKCMNPTNYSTAYKLSQTLTDSILFSGGGFLSVMVGWVLKQNQIVFQASRSIEGNEMDFLIDVDNNKWLVECKMHRHEIEPENLVQSWKKDSRKMDKKISLLEKQELKIERKIIVYNWPHSLLQDVVSKGRGVKSAKGTETELVGYDAFFEEVARLT